MTTRMTIDPVTFRDVPRSKSVWDDEGWDNSPVTPLPGLRCPHCTTESMVDGGMRGGKKSYRCLICWKPIVNPVAQEDN